MPPEMDAPLPSYGPSLRPSAPASAKASADASEGVPGPAAVMRRALHAVIPSALALLVIATGSNARADDSIKADTTLKSNNTVVTPSKADGKTTYTITGGAERNSGRYLFHSFAAFNLLKNEIGHFNNLNTVNTIFSRVTGLSQSSIDGLIRANGTANLYLINPKGIVFGPNARIDVGGAFKASTAEALLFEGKNFSAIDPQDAPVLTSDIVPGLQFGATPATLSNAGELVVKDGQEILLAGGPDHTVISSGTITANGGAITLKGGNITVSGGGIQDNNGGSINLSADQSLSVSGPVAIITETKGSGKGGDINLKGSSISIEKGAQISAQATKTTEDIFSKDSSGNILKDSSGNPIIEIAANKGVTGDAGDIKLSANNVSLKDKSIITTETQTTGKGGLISVDSDNLNLSGGSQLTTAATNTSTSKAGDINLNASTPRELSISFSGDGSIINTQTASQASGAAGKSGNINIGTASKTLSISGDINNQNAITRITAQSNGIGNGGTISLLGSNIIITDNAKVTTETTAAGNGGSINLSTGTLQLGANTQISTSASGSGAGGAITVAPAAVAPLQIKGPGLIETQPASSGVAGAIRIGSTSAAPGATTASDLSLSDGVRLQTSRSSVDLASTGTTSLQGGSITAAGSTVAIKGDTSVAIQGTEISALNPTIGQPSPGYITITGGAIKVGGETGRTLLRAGDAQVLSPEYNSASNLTLLDGGDGSAAAISLTGGANKTIQIFSGAAAPATAQGITNVRGATAVTATAPAAPTATPAHRIVVGGVLAGPSATTTSTSSATSVGSGSSLTANGGGHIDVLSTGTTSSGGTLETSLGAIKLSGDTTTINAGSLRADQGGSITINGSYKATISGANLSALNSATKSGSISVRGGDIQIGSDSGRTLLRAGNAPQLSSEEANTSNLTLLDSAVSLSTGAGKGIEVYSGTVASKGTATLRASGANSTDQNDANAVRLTTSGTGGNIFLGSRSANPSGVVSSTTIGDGVGITANDGSISFGTTGKISLGSGSLLQAGSSIDLRGNSTDEITTPFLNKIAGSSRWFIGQDVDINSTNYIPTSDRSLTINAPAITVNNFSLTPSASSWQVASGVALDLLANGSGGLNVQNLDLSFTRTGTGASSTSSDLFRATSEAGGTSISQGSKITAKNGGSIALLSAGTLSISGSLSSENSGSGSGGAITLKGTSVSLNGGQVVSKTAGSGTGAAITVDAGSLELSGGSQLTTQSTASGAGGAIAVAPSSAAPLSITGSGLIETTATSSGSAGAIRIGTNGTSGSPIASSTTLSGGVRLKTSRSSVDLSSTGTTSLEGGSIEASGGSIKLDGADTTISGGSLQADGGSITISGNNNTKLGRTSLTSKNGSISVNGGDIEVGSATGRTILLAGSGSLGADESQEKAPHLTLLDGGSGSIAAITLKGGENKAIQIFSGSALPATPQGISTVRGATAVTATAPPTATPATTPAHRIVVGGVLAGPSATSTTTSSATSVGSGSSLTANGGGRIDVLSTGAASFSGAISASQGTLNLKGSELSINGGSLRADDGSITVAGVNSTTVANSSTLSANGDGRIDVLSTGTTSISGRLSSENSGSGSGGAITLKGTSVSLNSGQVVSNSTGPGRGATITVEAGSLELSGGSQLLSQTSGSGPGGSIQLNSTTPRDLTIAISGDSLITSSTSQTGSGGDKGGDIVVGTANRSLSISGAGSVIAASSGSGNAGVIELRGSSVNLDQGAQLVSAASGAGSGGSINLSTKSLQLGDNSKISSSASGTGAGGAITVAPAAVAPLQIKGPGLIETQPASSGNAGAIRLGSTSADPGATTVSDLSLSDGVQLKTSRSSVELASTGTTSLQGGSITAAGSTVAIKGATSVAIQGTEISALNPTIGQPSPGSIAITGGAIKVGGDTGRTLLRAGDAQDLSAEELAATNFTLLDSAVTLTAAADKSIEVFSGKSANLVLGTPAIPGTTTLRTGITNDQISSNHNAIQLSVQNKDKFKSGSIVVGGVLNSNSTTPTTTSLNTTLTTGTSLSAKDIYTRSFGTLSDKSKKDGSTNAIAAFFKLNHSDLINTEVSEDNTYSYTATGGGDSKGNIELIFNQGETFESGLNSSGVVAKMRFTAKDNIEFQNVKINIKSDVSNSAGAFKLESENGDIKLENTKLNALGNDGTIFLSAKHVDGSILLNGNSELNTSIADGIKAGSIELNGKKVDINKSNIISLTTGSGSGGIIKVDAASLKLSDGSQLTTKASSTGAAGEINLNATTPRPLAITFSGDSLINAKTTQVGPGGGQGGTITIGTPSASLDIKGSGRITAETQGSGEGGSISLIGTDIIISNNAKVTAETTNAGIGGTVNVDAKSLTLAGGSQLTTAAYSTGDAGKIVLNAPAPSKPITPASAFISRELQVNLSDVNSIINASTSFSNSSQENSVLGKESLGGSIFIGTDNTNLSIIGPGTITAETRGSGKGGDITLKGSTINLDSSTFTVKTSGLGIGGSISFFSSDSINLSKGAEINAQASKTTLDTILTDGSGKEYIIPANKGITGDAGNISLSANEISLNGESIITAKTQTTGKGGLISIDSHTLNLSGGSQLTTAAYSTGDAGKIVLNAPAPSKPITPASAFISRELKVNLDVDSIINSSTSFVGDLPVNDPNQKAQGGSIFLGTADKPLSVTGPGTITVETKGSGKGGDINLEGTSISIENEAKINAQATKTTEDIFSKDSTGNILKDKSGNLIIEIAANKGVTGNAGDINLSANTISLNGESIITAETQTTGEGGLISLNSDKLNLFGGSQLTTAAYSTGDAGKIFLNAPDPTKTVTPASAFIPRELEVNLDVNSIINSSTSFVGDLPVNAPNQQAKGGSIFLGTADKPLYVTGPGIITVETKGSGKGGDINLEGTSISIENEAKINAQATKTTEDIFSKDSYGNILKDKSGNLIIEIAANKGVTGNAGDINLSANTISLNGESIITAETQTTGEGGLISLNSDKLNLFGGSQLTTAAYSTGDAGKIFLNAPDPTKTVTPASAFIPRELEVNLGVNSIINSSTSFVGALPVNEPNQKAQGGSIFLGTADKPLYVTGPGTITVETKGSGKGGDINLKGSSISIKNEAKINAQATKTTEDIFSKDSYGNILKDKSGNPIIEIAANKGVTGNAGDINLSANTISLNGESIITAESQTTGEGGLISVNSDKLNLFGGSQLTTEAKDTSTSKAGEINLNASTPRDLSISFSGDGSIINAKTESKEVGDLGKGGDINIGTATKALSINGPGYITAETMGTGKGGNINLKGTSINLDSSTFTVITSGSGSGGSISVDSSKSINLSNGAKINAQTEITTANKGITGVAGNISLSAENVSLQGKSMITAETETSGEGGIIALDSTTLNLAGGSQLTTEATNSSTSKAGNIYLNNPTDININPFTPRDLTISFSDKDSLINAQTASQGIKDAGKGGDIKIGTATKALTINGPGLITAETMGTGNGGNINLEGTSINLDSSTFTVKTSGSGTGGCISLNSSDSINLSNGAKINAQATKTTEDIFSKDSSGNPIIEIAANKGITGDAGNISISANNVTLKDKSIITAETQTSGIGGLISVDSNNLNLSGDSQLSTRATSSGNAGAIFLNASTPRDLSIAFSGNSLINAATEQSAAGGGQGGQGGTIKLGTSAKNLSVSGQGFITAETKGSGNGGDITLEGRSINVDAAQLTAQTSGTGAGGIVRATANSLGLDNKAKLTTQTSSTGKGGEISLLANTISLNRGAIATAETTGSGLGGTINVEADTLNLYSDGSSGGSQLSTRATSSGNAGAIFLNASTPRDLSIAFSGNSLINAATEQSAAGGGQGGTIKLGTSAKNLSIFGQGFITAETKGSGNGGGIDLNGSSISFDRGAVATAQTSGSGRGGTISVEANTITLDNRAKVSTRSSSGLDASPQPTGPAGSISITAAGPNSLHLRNGSQISSDTSSTIAWANDKDLANIIIKTPNLTLTGASSISASTSAAAKAGAINLISAFTELAGGSTIATASTGSGAGGNININGHSLQLSDASQIKADGGNFGQAGSINITLSDRLQLHNQSGINASTARSASKEGGANISITLGGDLILSNGTSITATASGKANGGNIKLLLPNGFLLSSFPGAFAGNDILASADAGDGGRIELRALGIFGMNINTFLTPISEASAKSRSGRDGVLALYIPFLTPDRGVVPIEQPLDPDNDLVRACSPRADGRRAEFTQTGRGGQPSLPGDRPTAAPLLDDLGRPAPRRGLQTSASPPSTSQPAPAAAIPIASAIQLQGYAPRLALPLPPCPEPR
jgi:filamentous hemagglutinin family protein